MPPIAKCHAVQPLSPRFCCIVLGYQTRVPRIFYTALGGHYRTRRKHNKNFIITHCIADCRRPRVVVTPSSERLTGFSRRTILLFTAIVDRIRGHRRREKGHRSDRHVAHCVRSHFLSVRSPFDCRGAATRTEKYLYNKTSRNSVLLVCARTNAHTRVFFFFTTVIVFDGGTFRVRGPMTARGDRLRYGSKLGTGYSSLSVSPALDISPL